MCIVFFSFQNAVLKFDLLSYKISMQLKNIAFSLNIVGKKTTKAIPKRRSNWA